jgi:hypothetical protein
MRSANILRIVTTLLLLAGLAGHINAQTGRVRTASVQPKAAPAPNPTPGEEGAALTPPAAPAKLRVTYIGSSQVDLSWDAPTDATSSITYVVERCDLGFTQCQNASSTSKTTINNTNDVTIIVTTTTTTIAAAASNTSGNSNNPFQALKRNLPTSATTYTDSTVKPGEKYVYQVRSIDSRTPSDQASPPISVATTEFTCLLFPVRGACTDFGDGSSSNINTFFQTNAAFSFLGQVKSTYNQASGSTTASADFASLNFGNGMQLTVTANAQAGSSGTATASSATVPTLSATGAAQATQNLLYGGNFLVSELYPVLAVGGNQLGNPGALGLQVDFVVKEGTDIQNFKSGTNVSVSSPPFHGSAHLEGYLQYNSINLIPKTQNFVGALFLGGSYGYNYISHDYAAEYGFGKHFNNGIGQISFGIVVNGVARITVSRAFGPSQTYFDSAATNPTTPATVNNFKAWSFGIVYQSQTPSK